MAVNRRQFLASSSILLSASALGSPTATAEPAAQTGKADGKQPINAGAARAQATNDMLERLTLREMIDNWALWRDASEWGKFRTLWHDDGRMVATWTEGSVDQFIEMSKQGFAKGLRALHFIGGNTIDIRGDRAVAQTKMTISQRAPVNGIVCDVICTGRFYDLFEKRAGHWGFVLRQSIYEKDRMDPVDSGINLHLDPEVLAKFPEGYRHLAYLQTQMGYKVKTNMPGLTGPEVEALYANGAAWLAGARGASI
jgi:hypothetical protein